MHKTLSVLALVSFCVALPSEAALIVYMDRGLFNAAAPGLPVETFEAGVVGAGGVVGCPSPLDSTSNNACFTAGSILPGIQFASSTTPDPVGIALTGPGYGGLPPTKAIFANYFVDTLNIQLLSPVNAVGFDLYSILPASTIDISVYDPSSGLLGMFSVPAGSSTVFWGVISDSGPIGSLNLASQSGGAEGVDNVAFGNSIPEPSTLSLAGAALLALGLLRRSR